MAAHPPPVAPVETGGEGSRIEGSGRAPQQEFQYGALQGVGGGLGHDEVARPLPGPVGKQRLVAGHRHEHQLLASLPNGQRPPPAQPGAYGGAASSDGVGAAGGGSPPLDRRVGRLVPGFRFANGDAISLRCGGRRGQVIGPVGAGLAGG